MGWASTGSGWQDRLIAGLRMLSLERPASNFRPWLVSGSLDFILGAFPPLPDKSGSLCLNCLYKQHGVCHTPAFLPEALNFCLHQAERAYVSSLNKNLGHRVSRVSLMDSISHVLSQVTGGSIKCTLWDSLGGLLEACTWLPCAFSLCCFCFVSFHCNKAYCEYDYFLSLSPSSYYQTWSCS